MYVRIFAAIAVSTAALAAGASAPAEQGRSPKAERKLVEGLDGRTAGQPVVCIQATARMTVIDDSTLLYRDRGIVYLQHPRGACRGLSKGMSLVRNTTGRTRLCSGDINSIVDLTEGYGTDACVFNDFVPYAKAE